MTRRYVTLIVILVLVTFAAPFAHANTPPEPQTNFVLADQFSTEFGQPFNLDLNNYFSDPDGDALTFRRHNFSPLPPGLNFDANSGILSGALLPDDLLGRPLYFSARDATDVSGIQVFVLWTTISYGANTSLFVRECDRFVDPIQCVPLIDYPNKSNYRGIPAYPIGAETPDDQNSTSLYPDPSQGVPFRASASVGYEGAELTPAISAFLRPDEERMTGQHFGIAQHSTSGDLTVSAELTYSHSGGAIAPANPLPGDPLDFGVMWTASLFSLRLAPAANGVFDPSLCDWNFFGPGAWGASIREALPCMLTPGMHPHVQNLQEEHFGLPDPGPEDAPNPTVLPPEPAGTSSASLTITHDPGNPLVWIGVRMFQMARFHGEANSQNTLRVTFDNPDAVAPAMPSVSSPTFVPAPDSTGEVTVAEGECIRLDGKGFVKVILWGTADMQAELIDPFSIRFGGLDVATNGNSGQPGCSLDDFDADGMQDLQCRFVDDPALYSGTDTQAELSWSTPATGQSFTATADICFK